MTNGAAKSGSSAVAFSIAGTWIYRSYLNDPVLVGNDANKALSLIFGEGTFVLARSASGAIGGTFDMGGGYFLDMAGQVRGPVGEAPQLISMIGKGRTGTPTAGWQYDYQAYPNPTWPAGVNQVPTFVGTALRAVPHNGKPAGVTASFIMIQQKAA